MEFWPVCLPMLRGTLGQFSTASWKTKCDWSYVCFSTKLLMSGYLGVPHHFFWWYSMCVISSRCHLCIKCVIHQMSLVCCDTECHVCVTGKFPLLLLCNYSDHVSWKFHVRIFLKITCLYYVKEFVVFWGVHVFIEPLVSWIASTCRIFNQLFYHVS